MREGSVLNSTVTVRPSYKGDTWELAVSGRAGYTDIIQYQGPEVECVKVPGSLKGQLKGCGKGNIREIMGRVTAVWRLGGHRDRRGLSLERCE